MTYRLLIMGIALAACTAEQRPGDCGTGKPLSTMIGMYCVHIVVEGGFECPAEFMYRYDFEGGGSACSDASLPPEELPRELCAEYDEDDCSKAMGPFTGVKPQRRTSEEDVLIGALLPMERSLEGSTEASRAVRMVVDEVKDAGGLLGGSTLSLLTEVVEEKPASSVSAFEQWVTEGVVAVAGPSYAEHSHAVLPSAVSGETPFLSTWAAAEPSWVTSQAAGTPWGRSSLEHLVVGLRHSIANVAADDLACSTASLIMSDTGDGNDYVVDTLAQALTARGIDLRQSAPTPPYLPADISDTCQDLWQIAPDCVVVESSLAAYYVRDCVPSDQNEPRVVLVGELIPPLLQGIADSLAPLNDARLLIPQRVHETRSEQFASLYQTEYSTPLSDEVLVNASHYYDHAAVIALAIEQAGSTDGTAIRDAISAVGDDTGEVVVEPGELAKGLAAIREGKTINYQGAGGTADYSFGATAVSLDALCRYVVDAETFIDAPCN